MEAKDWIAVCGVMVQAGGAYLLYRAFRLNTKAYEATIQAQANPLRTELFKKRCELVTHLMSSANRLVKLSQWSDEKKFFRAKIRFHEAKYALVPFFGLPESGQVIKSGGEFLATCVHKPDKATYDRSVEALQELVCLCHHLLTIPELNKTTYDITQTDWAKIKQQHGDIMNIIRSEVVPQPT